MFKTLLKKQFSEVFSFIFVDRRKGKKRDAGGIILLGALYFALFLFLMGSFYTVAGQLCPPLVSAGLAWFYFAIIGIASLLFGVLGSAFATYASMYVAKDNEMLFSMPIKPRTILASRLVSVFLLSFIYIIVMYLPATVAYAAEVSSIGFVEVLLLALTPFALALLASAISCLLGWLISLVAKRIKNKSFVTVIAVLLFVGIYYFFYFRMSSVINRIILAPHQFSETIRTYAYPFYLLGRGAAGDAMSFLLFALICIAAGALVFALVSLGFAKTVIGGGSVSHVKKKALYSDKDIRSASASHALFKKELSRFTSSPNYMLNSSIGLVFMLGAAVMLFIKGGSLRDLLAGEASIYSDSMALIICAAACMLSSMNIITASSVSLEGKHIWLVQSLPVEPKSALLAKLKLQLALVLPVLTLLLAALLTTFRLPLLHCVIVCTASVLFVLFFALFGLAANLKWANLKWTNEVIPLKQSLPVFLATFGGMVILALLGFAYYLLSSKLGVEPLTYLVIVASLFALLCAILYRLITTWGAKRFADLN